MQAPNGRTGIIPRAHVVEAMRSGGTVLFDPATVATQFEQERDPANQSGLASNWWDTIKGALTPQAQNPYPGMGVEQKVEAADRASQADQYRQDTGRSLPYRILAGIGGAITPANVPTMERSADIGNTRGVIGSALGGMTVAASPLAAEGLIKGAMKGADVAANRYYRRATSAAVRATEPSAATLPAQALQGVERLYREPHLQAVIRNSAPIFTSQPAISRRLRKRQSRSRDRRIPTARYESARNGGWNQFNWFTSALSCFSIAYWCWAST